MKVNDFALSKAFCNLQRSNFDQQRDREERFCMFRHKKRFQASFHNFDYPRCKNRTKVPENSAFLNVKTCKLFMNFVIINCLLYNVMFSINHYRTEYFQT